jgi:hypothetical protein
MALNDVTVVNSLSLTTASSISGRTFSSQGAISLDGGTGVSLAKAMRAPTFGSPAPGR